MIKLESKKDELVIECSGSGFEVSVDFSKVALAGIEKVGEIKEEAGIVSEGKGKLHVLATLVSQFIVQESGRTSPFDLMMNVEKIKEMEKQVADFISAAIEDFNQCELEEAKGLDKFDILLKFFFGIEPDEEEPEGEADGKE